MTELKKYTWLWLMGCMMLLAACSSEKKEDDSWYRPIDEFVTQHQQMMQSQPDSMILQIRNLKCGGKPELVEQWKRLIVAKCCYLKGADRMPVAYRLGEQLLPSESRLGNHFQDTVVCR